MASRHGILAMACASGLVGCGMAAATAWRGGVWGSLVGALLVAACLAGSIWRLAVERDRKPATTSEARSEGAGDRLLLDAAPAPMLQINGSDVRVLNRAARRLFATDDRVVPAPAALIRSDEPYVRHEGRQYRVDRVVLEGRAGRRSVATLVDVEREERVAEARATAEMIHVLGHELLNGLAPIVSLAESGEAALGLPDPDPALLREILRTLARRAEGLQRFTQGYRDLARLPEPRRTLTSAARIAHDLSRLFEGRWPGTMLLVHVADGPECLIDQDQIHQAVWALLQNAAEAADGHGGTQARVCLTIRFVAEEMIIEVQDSGAGVPADQAIRIFRPFHTTKAEGTGIGLSLARQIALAHGGSLRLLAEPPTTFRLMVPIVQISGFRP